MKKTVWINVFCLIYQSPVIWTQTNLPLLNEQESSFKMNKITENDLDVTALFFKSSASSSLKEEISGTVSEAVFYDLNKDILAKIIKDRPQKLSLSLKDPSGNPMQVELIQTFVFSKHAKFGIVNNGIYQEQEYIPGVYYHGTISNHVNGIASFSFFENEVQALLSDNTGNWILGLLKEKEQYIFYNDKKLLKPFHFDCGTADLEKLEKEVHYFEKTTCPIDLFWVGDFDFFAVSGYNYTNSINNLSAIFNNVSLLYQQEGITLNLSEVYIHSTPDNYDEWNSLNAFNSFGYNIHQASNFNEDLAMLLAVNTNGNSQSYGVIDGLCANFSYGQSGKYAYSRIETYAYQVPVYSWTINVVAHEMGHNVGSRHTHWCGWPVGPLDNCTNVEPDNFGNYCNPGPYPSDGGTIMSYCANVLGSINFSNGFGYYPHQEIINDIAWASTADCICKPLEIEKNEWITLDLFPNPGSHLIEIQTQENQFTLKIFNSLGQLLLTSDNCKQIDISDLSDGVYSILLVSENTYGKTRFIKQE